MQKAARTDVDLGAAVYARVILGAVNKVQRRRYPNCPRTARRESRTACARADVERVQSIHEQAGAAHNLGARVDHVDRCRNAQVVNRHHTGPGTLRGSARSARNTEGQRVDPPAIQRIDH